MSCLSWKCPGLSLPWHVQELKSLVHVWQPSFIFYVKLNYDLHLWICLDPNWGLQEASLWIVVEVNVLN